MRATIPHEPMTSLSVPQKKDFWLACKFNTMEYSTGHGYRPLPSAGLDTGKAFGCVALRFDKVYKWVCLLQQLQLSRLSAIRFCTYGQKWEAFWKCESWLVLGHKTQKSKPEGNVCKCSCQSRKDRILPSVQLAAVWQTEIAAIASCRARAARVKSAFKSILNFWLQNP